MARPRESDYTSHVGYTRALEAYCDKIEIALDFYKLAKPVEKSTWCNIHGSYARYPNCQQCAAIEQHFRIYRNETE
jgi:hypothetical protein